MKYPLYETLSACTVFSGVASTPSELLYLMGCSNYKQFCSTLRGLLNPEKYCPFCRVAAGTEMPILSRRNWYLRENDFPKPNSRMLLILPKRHLINPQELSGSDWSEIGYIFDRACSISEIEGGALVMRFGKPQYHAGTIPHLHFNVISPNPDTEFRIPLSKDEIDRRANYVRMLEYRNKLIEKGGIEWLFSVEAEEFLA